MTEPAARVSLFAAAMQNPIARWRRWPSVALVAGVATLGPLRSVAAQTVPDAAHEETPRIWTDADVQARARHAAFRVRRAEHALRVAQAGRVFGELPRVGNPTIGVVALPGLPDYGALTYAVSLGLPIDLLGVGRARAREAEAAVQTSAARLDAERAGAVAEARGAWVSVGVARSLEAIQRTRLASATEAATRMQARVDAGESTALDRLLVERERASAEADLARATRQRLEATDALRMALDLAPRAPLDVAPLGYPTSPTADALARAEGAAAARRGEVRAATASATEATARGVRQGREAVAPLTVGLEGQQVAVGPQETASSLGLSLRWELPVARRGQGERAVASAEASTARADARALGRVVTREVDAAARRLQGALAELEALEQRALPTAERLEQQSEVTWAAGNLEWFRVLEARRGRLELAARALEVLREAWLARIELDRSTGE